MLRLDFCSFAAARFAVLRWHYSHKMPCGRLVRIGVWEDKRFIGAVLFGHGASPYLAQRWGVARGEVVELVRVALIPASERKAKTSKVVAIALRMFRKVSPSTKLIVSFADLTDQGHVGTIYQATNWYYVGVSQCRHVDFGDGETVHSRGRYSRRGRTGEAFVYTGNKVKHYYVMPCTDELSAKVSAIAVPYPVGKNRTRAASETSDTPTVQVGKGGATPTAALHPSSNG